MKKGIMKKEKRSPKLTVKGVGQNTAITESDSIDSLELSFFSYYIKDFCLAWDNFAGKHIIIALLHLLLIFFGLMFAYIDYTRSVLKKVAPLEKLERFDGTLSEIIHTYGKRSKHYVVIRSQGELHKLRLCTPAFSQNDWDVLKAYQGQLIKSSRGSGL